MSTARAPRIAGAALGLALLVGILFHGSGQAAAFDNPVVEPPAHGPVDQPLALPDLVVHGYTVGYSAADGWYLDITVRNQGSDAAGGFYATFRQWERTYTAYGPGLAKGGSGILRFSHIAGFDPDFPGGTIAVDTYNQVRELDEGNNTKKVPSQVG